MKRVISILAIFVLCFSVIFAPMEVFAAKKKEGKDLNGNKWKYNSSAKTLIFSGTKELQDCNTSHEGLEGSWFVWKNRVKKVVVKNGIKQVSVENFYGFKNLKVVKLPESVIYIRDAAFCETSLKTIKLPKKLKKIDSHAFSSTKIKKIKLPKGLEYIGSGAFEETPIQNIVIPDSVTLIGSGAFLGCEELQSVTLSKNITRINVNTFNFCGKLKKIVIRSKKIWDIDEDAFDGISSNATFYVPKKMKKKYTKMLKKCDLGKNVKIVGVRM